ncbi:group II intron reverse transcriptase/maturase [Paraburkholderia sp. RP-4-7]|uniref:Group II intron reverse transcriptase/maturase n=1 Tax=Paraburkholderia polaris TaxID=2728848 RepID=A0A848IQH2_9BURK|nr:group II intron reverse transcriptase/maturase [Paraburkholderia polaris]NMM04598.1 group II intron reverse transcriptase/maturase [Paraburkholderia polaris]
MTAIGGAAQAEAIDAGASSRPAEMWLQADWPRITDEVKRLQARIAQATKEGRWGKVSALQRLLTRSHSGKMLAVKRVTENRGKRTPGVDGKTWPTPAAKWKGVEAMQHRSYRALPLRRIYIPKSNGKNRPLGIPRMLCRSMQALWKLALEPIAESLADPNSYGFRPKRSTADAIEYCFTTLAKRKSPEWVLEGDIRGCFDNFSHDWILKHIPMDKEVLRRWLKAGFIDKGTLFATEAGTPQGGIISPVIANMTLDGLEAAVDASVGPTPRACRKFKVNVNRYADDFVVTGVSKDILEQNVLPAVRQFLAVRGLELSEEKTRVTHIADGFDFLGQNVRKYADKLLIKPASKSVKALLEKVREIVRQHRSATQTNLILQLNPVIRGWAMYHRHVVSKSHFTSIDAHIWQLLWKWAMRRHPTKGTGWVKHKYFHVEGHRTWAFTARTKDRGVIRLFRATMIPIVRHVKIRGQANPFDPAWSPYFARRRTATDG